MITVLIADDEHLLRQLILNSVQWEELGLEAVGEAEDGECALRMIRDKKPDIAILDINMPFMNGIEVAGEVFRENLPTRLLILTGYRDFEFARMAVTYHVRDYLLKPIQADELNAALARMVEEVRYDQSLQDATDIVRERTRAEEFLRRQARVRELLKGEVPDSGALKELDLENGPCRAMVLRPDVYEGDRGTNQSLFSLVYAACGILKERGFERCEGCVEEDAYALVLVNAGEDDGEQLKACAEQMRAAFRMPISVGVSRSFDGLDGAAEAAEQALLAMNDRFYQSQGRVYCAWEEPMDDSVRCNEDTAMLVADIHQMLKSADWVRKDDCIMLLESAFEAMRSQRLNEDYAKMTAVSFVSVLLTNGMSGDTARPVGRSGSVVDRVMGCQSFDALRHETMDIFNAYRELIVSGGNAPALSRRVSQAKAYIEDNFAESSLSLNRLAGMLYVNPTYISNQFRKEMNITITEYITACRMRAAVRIIGEEPDTPLVEVAQRVGYRDPYYFSKSFKKYYGVTPKRYSPADQRRADA